MEERINHAVTIDMSSVIQGENTFQCTLTGQEIILIWHGKHFSLTEADANDPTMGEIKFNYIGDPPR